MVLRTEDIWVDFNNKLLIFIRKRVKNEEVAKDILQDVFLKIQSRLHTLTSRDKLTAWVFQITRNSINDHFRKNKRAMEFTLPIDVSEDIHDLNHEFSQCLKSMVGFLPNKYREAIQMTDLGDLSQKEFAEIKGISYSGAKSRVQRGREQLHNLFVECCRLTSDKYGNIISSQEQTDCKKC